MSVIAVKIQFNSPSIVLRSLSCPGILSTDSSVILGTKRDVFCKTNHRRAILSKGKEIIKCYLTIYKDDELLFTLIGVVRHAVNKSAGSSEFIGRI